MDEPAKLTDDELNQLVYLYRVVRAENHTASELEELRDLMKRYYVRDQFNKEERRRGKA